MVITRKGFSKKEKIEIGKRYGIAIRRDNGSKIDKKNDASKINTIIPEPEISDPPTRPISSGNKNRNRPKPVIVLSKEQKRLGKITAKINEFINNNYFKFQDKDVENVFLHSFYIYLEETYLQFDKSTNAIIAEWMLPKIESKLVTPKEKVLLESMIKSYEKYRKIWSASKSYNGEHVEVFEGKILKSNNVSRVSFIERYGNDNRVTLRNRFLSTNRTHGYKLESRTGIPHIVGGRYRGTSYRWTMVKNTVVFSDGTTKTFGKAVTTQRVKTKTSKKELRERQFEWISLIRKKFRELDLASKFEQNKHMVEQWVRKGEEIDIETPDTTQPILDDIEKEYENATKSIENTITEAESYDLQNKELTHEDIVILAKNQVLLQKEIAKYSGGNL